MGFKNLSFFRFLENLKKPQKRTLGLLFYFNLRNLINKPHIQILTVISEIYQFHLNFSHGVLLLRSLEICFSKIRRTVRYRIYIYVYGVFLSAFRSYFRVRPAYNKN